MKSPILDGTLSSLEAKARTDEHGKKINFTLYIRLKINNRVYPVKASFKQMKKMLGLHNFSDDDLPDLSKDDIPTIKKFLTPFAEAVKEEAIDMTFHVSFSRKTGITSLLAKLHSFTVLYLKPTT